MRMNVAKSKPLVFTHEGARAYQHIAPENQLRRLVMSCFLWEDEFYVDGKTIAEQIEEAALKVPPAVLSRIAIEARRVHNLRHVPLLLTAILAKTGSGTGLVSETIQQVIRRADEPGELISIYWRKGRCPLSAQMKKGLAKAITRFDAYQLAKYNRDAAVKLRDVLFMTHAKAKDETQAADWKALVDGTLQAPDTWEVALSAGADKRETFERLIREGNLGYLALLRNLRNMTQVGVDTGLIRDAIVSRKNGADRVLPFRYVAAARACPQMEPALDQALCEAISEMPAFSGRTAVMVDVSRSMYDKLSAKSDMTRMDAAAALASIIHGDVRMFSFSDRLVEAPPRRGMAGVDAVVKSQPHNGTALFDAIDELNRTVSHDRLIVITDEQASAPGIFGYRIQGRITRLPDPVCERAYMINVASAKNGVGYGKWVHLDGFSEGVLRFIHAYENDR